MWIFVEFYVAFSNWLLFFISGGWIYKFMWHRLVDLMWNAHMVLNDHEIWYACNRHMIEHDTFGPIHLSIDFIELWIFEMEACVDVVIWSI
jgi:hypothetical protein